MELRVLRYFLTIAREGSITNAANALHVTQPTLSRQIRDLEEELGQPLFVRGSHNVTLTPEGMLLRKRAEEIIDLVSKTEQEFAQTEETLSGDVYIGAGETEAVRFLARAAKKLQSTCPDIRYHITSGNAELVLERLHAAAPDGKFPERSGDLLPGRLLQKRLVSAPFRPVQNRPEIIAVHPGVSKCLRNSPVLEQT